MMYCIPRETTPSVSLESADYTNAASFRSTPLASQTIPWGSLGQPTYYSNICSSIAPPRTEAPMTVGQQILQDSIVVVNGTAQQYLEE